MVIDLYQEVNSVSLASRINEIRRNKKISIDELCELSGVPKGTMSKITAGITTSPTLDTVKAIARALDCKLDDLDDISQTSKKAPPYSSEALKLAKDYDMLDTYGKRQVRGTADLELERCKAQLQSDEKDDEQKTRVIPLFRTPAAAGYVSPTEGQDYDDYEIPYNLPGDFAVRIDGDSMEPYIHDGEIVRCVRSNGLKIGDVGIFYVDGDTLCKQYCTDGSNLYLLSLNRKRADADRTVWHFSNSTVQLYGKVLMRKKPPMP